MNITTLQVSKGRFSANAPAHPDSCTLQPGQIRVKVNSFALTSNNITYAAFGDAMSYWQFWPTDDAVWGVIPFGASPPWCSQNTPKSCKASACMATGPWPTTLCWSLCAPACRF